MPSETETDLHRAIRQRLESFRLAGMTYLPKPPPPSEDVAGISASVSEKGSEVKKTAAPEEPSQDLSTIRAAVAQCVRCTELAATRTQTVFAAGDPDARIMFVGEAPGADEDRQGEPFVGAAGQLLNKIITACRLTREEIYICNILKCRPPGNRNPTTNEANNCREYLDAQIACVRPDYIVCWGTVAAQNLLGTTETIGRMRQKFYTHAGAKVLCTYHPSYLLRNPSAKKGVWEDMIFWRKDMGVDLAEQ